MSAPSTVINYEPDASHDSLLTRLDTLSDLFYVAKVDPSQTAHVLAAMIAQCGDALSDDWIIKLVALGLDLERASTIYDPNHTLAMTPLQGACTRFQPEAIIALTDAGANPNGHPKAYRWDGNYCLDILLLGDDTSIAHVHLIESCLRPLDKLDHLERRLSFHVSASPSLDACIKHSDFVTAFIETCE
jgi:hypothetical protein